MFYFRLFVAGDTPRSREAIEQAERLCQELPPGRCELEIIDAFESPALAETDGIVVTPTLLCLSPYPNLRIVGQINADDLLVRFLPPADKLM